MSSQIWSLPVCRYDQIRQQVAEDELRECTFHPKINHTSKQLARGQQPGASPDHHADRSEPAERGTFGADPSLPFGTTRRVSLVAQQLPATQPLGQLCNGTLWAGLLSEAPHGQQTSCSGQPLAAANRSSWLHWSREQQVHTVTNQLVACRPRSGSTLAQMGRRRTRGARRLQGAPSPAATAALLRGSAYTSGGRSC